MIKNKIFTNDKKTCISCTVFLLFIYNCVFMAKIVMALIIGFFVLIILCVAIFSFWFEYHKDNAKKEF